MLNSRQMELLGDPGSLSQPASRRGSKYSSGVVASSPPLGLVRPDYFEEKVTKRLQDNLKALSVKPSAGSYDSPSGGAIVSRGKFLNRRVGSTSALERRRVTVDIGEMSGPRATVSSSAAGMNVKALLRGSPSTSSVGDKAAVLAHRHRLELQEVRTVLKELDEGAQNARHKISEKEFSRILCKIFHVSILRDDVVRSAYTASRTSEGEIDPDKFLTWYVQNMFAAINALNADKGREQSDSLVYKLARQYDVKVDVIDKIKHKFDHFDLDGSGEIDFEEFRAMIFQMMKVNDDGDLSGERLKGFWREIDKDGSGAVDFCEFTEWYLKYFHTGEEGGSILRQFYQSYNPGILRRRSLESMDQEDTS